MRGADRLMKYTGARNTHRRQDTLAVREAPTGA